MTKGGRDARLKAVVKSAVDGISLPLISQSEYQIAVPFFSMQGSAQRRTPGLVNFVPALAYPFCLALPAAFTQPGDHLLVEPCTSAPPRSP